MKKSLFLLLIWSFAPLVYAQNHFEYLWYIDESVRDGTLYYDAEKDEALYIDKCSNMRNYKESAQKADIVMRFNGVIDGYYFKKNSPVIQYTADLIKDFYFITDHMGKMEWQLVNETKEIQGYTCYKALTKFRERKWEVWYSPEIPIQYGPWKFYNLPGLLFEATDETKRFAFRLKEIKTTDELKNLSIDLKKYNPIDLKGYEELLSEIRSLDFLPKDRGYVIERVETSKNQGIESVYEWEQEGN